MLHSTPPPRALALALASVLALAAGARAQEELPEERAEREARLRARDAVRGAYDLLVTYGRGLPPVPPSPPSPGDLRDLGRHRLSLPLEPRRRAPERAEVERQHPEQADAELRETRAMILARLALLAPEKYGPQDEDEPAPREDTERTERPLVPRIIDVRDLVYEPEDHPGTNVGLGVDIDRRGAYEGGAGGVLAFADADHSVNVGLDAEKICELVAEVLGGDGSVEFSAGRLIVRQTPEGLRRIDELLTQLRRDRAGLVDLELRVYHMPQAVFAELRGQASALTQDGERALALAVADGKATLASSHRVVAHDGQLVNVRRGPSRAFVADIEVDQTGVVPVINPVTALLNEGLMVEVRPRVDRARGRAHLDVSASISRMTGKAELREVKGVELELPALDLSRLAASTVVPLGRGALIGGVIAGGEGGPLACVIYIRPQLVQAKR